MTSITTGHGESRSKQRDGSELAQASIPPIPAGGQSRGQDGIVQALWQRKWVVVFMVLLASASAAVFLYRATPIYRSASRIYIEQHGKKIWMDQGTINNTDSYLFLQCELIRSDAVLSLVKEDVPEKATRPIVPRAIKGGLQVSFTPKDGIITLTYDSPDAREAARIVNAVVRAYAAYQSHTDHSSTFELLDLLQTQREKVAHQLDAGQRDLAKFQQAHGTIILPKDSLPELAEVSKLSDAVCSAELQAIDAKALQDAVKALQGNPAALERMIESSGIKGVGLPVDIDMRQAQQQLTQVRQDIAELEGRRQLPGHPDLVQRRQQEERLLGQLAALDVKRAGRYVELVNELLLAAETRLARLREALTVRETHALSADMTAREFNRLDTVVQRTQKLQDLLEDRIKDVQINQDVDAIRVGILEPAEASMAQMFPKVTQTYLAAILGGLVLGIGCALLLRWIDQRIRTSEEIRTEMAIRVLGVIPRLNGKRRAPPPGMAVHVDPHSRFAEAYRAIRTGVFFGARGLMTGKTLLVTSPEAGDGKTVSVSNLATAIAQAGQRTLIIDADLRSPAQHRVFSVSNRIGLSSMLLGTASLKNAIVPTSVPGLDLMPSGPVPGNPSEMLGGQAFGALLEELTARYDYVVIDSPPVLSVTDAGILGAICDMTLLVLRWNKSTRSAGQHARDILLSVGARIFGGLVNDVPRGYRGYDYYGYGHAASLPAPVAVAAVVEAAGYVHSA